MRRSTITTSAAIAITFGPEQSAPEAPPDRSWLEFDDPCPSWMLWTLTAFLPLIVVATIVFAVVVTL